MAKEMTIAELNEWRKGFEGRPAVPDIDRLFDEIANLKALLLKYGGHTANCLSLRINPGPRAKCSPDCNWQAAAESIKK